MSPLETRAVCGKAGLYLPFSVPIDVIGVDFISVQVVERPVRRGGAKQQIVHAQE